MDYRHYYLLEVEIKNISLIISYKCCGELLLQAEKNRGTRFSHIELLSSRFHVSIREDGTA